MNLTCDRFYHNWILVSCSLHCCILVARVSNCLRHQTAPICTTCVPSPFCLKIMSPALLTLGTGTVSLMMFMLTVCVLSSEKLNYNYKITHFYSLQRFPTMYIYLFWLWSNTKSSWESFSSGCWATTADQHQESSPLMLHFHIFNPLKRI